MIKLDLGGTTSTANGWTTVNAVPPATKRVDFVAKPLSQIWGPGTVDAIRMVHTLEHIPATKFKGFLAEVLRVLKPGGVLYVLNTDVLAFAAEAYGNPSLEAAWKTVAFTPPDRLATNPYNLHQNAWSQALLEAELNAVGFVASNLKDSPDEWAQFRADLGPYFGESWPYDLTNELTPELTNKVQGHPIPNLAVKALKP